ncbi:hypothetical protein L6R50_26690 [Myxococcota bacterium]|nr:hypothetical protein [Myxococcota bacterium]
MALERIPRAANLGLALVALLGFACTPSLGRGGGGGDDDDDDDDSWATDDDASDDDASDDDASDDDASDDDVSDDDVSDDDTSDDDTFPPDDDVSDDDVSDDDTVLSIVQVGTADLAPSATWANWNGEESYAEYLGAHQTCDIGYSTRGTRSDECEFCEFSFDVTYDVQYDDSTVDCYYYIAPGDGDTLSLGYYYYSGYYGTLGLLLYYAYGGWYYWGFADVTGNTIDYWFPYY